MWRALIILALAGNLFLVGNRETSAQGCREFGEFFAGSAQAPGAFGQLVQERVPDFSEDVAGFMETFCEDA